VEREGRDGEGVGVGGVSDGRGDLALRRWGGLGTWMEKICREKIWWMSCSQIPRLN